jgi:hypothetical protein
LLNFGVIHFSSLKNPHHINNICGALDSCFCTSPDHPRISGFDIGFNHPECFSNTGLLTFLGYSQIGPDRYMSSSKMLPVIQILVVVVAVGAIAIGALKLFTPRVSDEADTPLGSDVEPTEMDEPESPEEAPPSPTQESGEPASEAETTYETGETIVEPCLVRVEALNLSRETVYAGEAVEAIVLLRNLGGECVYDL